MAMPALGICWALDKEMIHIARQNAIHGPVPNLHEAIQKVQLYKCNNLPNFGNIGLDWTRYMLHQLQCTMVDSLHASTDVCCALSFRHHHLCQNLSSCLGNLVTASLIHQGALCCVPLPMVPSPHVGRGCIGYLCELRAGQSAW